MSLCPSHALPLSALETATLPISQLQTLPPSLLSLLVLALLERRSLLFPQPSAALLLATAWRWSAALSTDTLINSIVYLRSLGRKQAGNLPRFSLQSGVLSNYIATLQHPATSGTQASNRSNSSISINNKSNKSKVIHTSLTTETRQAAASLLLSLITNKILPAKFVHIFRSSLKGNNLVYLEDSRRAELCDILQALGHPTATKLAAIYTSVASNRTPQERITMDQLAGKADSLVIDNSISEQRKHRTISEVIAERKQQQERQSQLSATLSMMASIELELSARQNTQEKSEEQEEQEEQDEQEELPELDGALDFPSDDLDDLEDEASL